jgi:hypothetical protein
LAAPVNSELPRDTVKLHLGGHPKPAINRHRKTGN